MPDRDAPGSHPYDRHVGRYGPGLARAFAGFAAISSGQRVLDVGCGTGQLTAELAGLVGGERVVAVDLSESALSTCRARMPDADVRLASAQDLPFAAGEFDAALAQLVVNLVDDPTEAVREMTRVVRPGGVVAACFWDNQEMPFLRSLWDSIGAVAPEALDAPGERRQVGPNLGTISDWWAGAGLADIAMGEFEVGVDYEDFDDLWSPFEDGIGHSGQTYLALPANARVAVREEAFRRLGSPRRAFRLAARAHGVRGRR